MSGLMLTKSWTRRIAQRDGVGMQVLERDYLQQLILWHVYMRTQRVIVKGSTTLRQVPGGISFAQGKRYPENPGQPLGVPVHRVLGT